MFQVDEEDVDSPGEEEIKQTVAGITTTDISLPLITDASNAKDGASNFKL